VLKIGDFSRLGSVTVKTLRHYARLGLLKPAWTDRFSGYRYYTLQQLTRLNRILALKDLGFSLDQVAGLIGEDVPVEQLRGMLRRKQGELETRLRAEQNRLEQVAARLAQLERAGCLGESENVLVKHSPALPVAFIHELVPTVERLAERRAALAAELDAWLARAGLKAQGPWITLQPAPEYRERDVPLEVAVPVEPAVVHRAKGDSAKGDSAKGDSGGRVKLRTLMPASELACLVHTGPEETLGQAYAALYTWMEANHRKPAGPSRELYLRDAAQPNDPFDPRPPEDAAAQAVEIQIPVTPIANETDGQSRNRENNMQPKIITRPAFDVMGLCYHGNNQNQEIAAMWGEFNQRAPEILPAAVPDTGAYGVCLMAEGLPEGHFEYVAGFEVREGAAVPEGMVTRRVPAQKYAVFSHTGPLDSLRETYNNIYQVWLPQSGLELTGGMDMEVYTDEFTDFAPDSVFYIYVPVK
jgi:predicted transcriptional regulator YdeE/DNA-binding transcriptional MerR regulator